MTDSTQEPRDLIQICTDIYYECGTIKRLDELTDEALDWHNKQVKNAVATAEDNLDHYWNKELDKQIVRAMIDTLEYAKISPKFKIEEKIEQLRLEAEL